MGLIRVFSTQNGFKPVSHVVLVFLKSPPYSSSSSLIGLKHMILMPLLLPIISFMKTFEWLTWCWCVTPKSFSNYLKFGRNLSLLLKSWWDLYFSIFVKNVRPKILRFVLERIYLWKGQINQINHIKDTWISKNKFYEK